MDVLTKQAYERIGDALTGRAPNGFTAVKAGDVLAVGALIKPEARSGVVNALMKGAANNSPDEEIWQKTDHLMHLLEQAK